MTTTDLTALVKTTAVPQAPADAFRLFTAGFDRWWPRRTHSVGGERSAAVAFPAAVGEQIVETLDDGTTAAWGTVTLWEPPGAVEFTWHPGTSPGQATSVRVTFEASGAGTLVTLTHSGWDRRADGHCARGEYDIGWDRVLAVYAGSAADAR